MAAQIRVTVRAVIVRKDTLLLSEYDDDVSGLHYNLPGGGVEAGEGLHEALRREVREETGLIASVERQLFVWEYLPQKPNARYGDQQTLALCFACNLLDDSGEPRFDPSQTGVRWIAWGDLARTPLLPPEITPYLLKMEATNGGLFLGQI